MHSFYWLFLVSLIEHLDIENGIYKEEYYHNYENKIANSCIIAYFLRALHAHIHVK